MKKLSAVVLASLACACLLFALSACQTAPQSSGLEVPKGSTGDPPLIPHEVEESDGGAECIGCHATGEMDAPVYPEWHATLVDCRQCHVPADDKGVKPFKTSY